MIIKDSLDEVKKRENALSIIKDIVENNGRESLFDLTGLSGGFIATPSELSLLETYVGPAIFEDALQEVGQRFASAGQMEELTEIVEQTLGRGGKVSECSKSQIQAMVIILDDLRERADELGI